MLFYKCKQCGQFTTHGLVNEFNEHFCRETCYKRYCESNSHEPHLERLKTYEEEILH